MKTQGLLFKNYLEFPDSGSRALNRVWGSSECRALCDGTGCMPMKPAGRWNRKRPGWHICIGSYCWGFAKGCRKGGSVLPNAHQNQRVPPPHFCHQCCWVPQPLTSMLALFAWIISPRPCSDGKQWKSKSAFIYQTRRKYLNSYLYVTYILKIFSTSLKN